MPAKRKGLFDIFRNVVGEIQKEAEKTVAKATHQKAPTSTTTTRKTTKKSTGRTSTASRNNTTTRRTAAKETTRKTMKKNYGPMSTPPVVERYREQRTQREVTHREKRFDRFNKYLEKIPADRDPQTDAFNQAVIERFIAEYGEQRDLAEQHFDETQAKLAEQFQKRLHRMSQKHSEKLQRMIDTANAGHRIRVSNDTDEAKLERQARAVVRKLNLMPAPAKKKSKPKRQTRQVAASKPRRRKTRRRSSGW